MSPIVQSGDRPCFVTHQTEPSALGKTTIATGNLSSHATEPNVGLPQKLAKKKSRKCFVRRTRGRTQLFKFIIASGAFLLSLGEFFFDRFDHFLVIRLYLGFKASNDLSIL